MAFKAGVIGRGQRRSRRYFARVVERVEGNIFAFAGQNTEQRQGRLKQSRAVREVVSVEDGRKQGTEATWSTGLGCVVPRICDRPFTDLTARDEREVK